MYKYLVIICSLLVVGMGCASSGTPDTNTDLSNRTPTDISDSTDWSNNGDNSNNNLNVNGDGSDKFDADDKDSGDAGAVPVEIKTTEDDFDGIATKNIPFEEKLEAKGGSGRYVWSVSGLPTGLSLENARVKIITIKGRARAAGSFSITAQVCDSNNLEDCDSKTYSILVRDIMVQTRYAPQAFSHSSSFAPADIPETEPANPCGTPLQITMKSTSYPDRPFGDADVNKGSSMMGNDFEATFQVTGGVPPYTWELRSAAEDFWMIGTIPENPSSWSRRQSTVDAENDTFNIEGTFNYGLRLCPAYPVPTIINTDGTTSVPDTLPEMVPTSGSCPDSESIEEVLTVKVTDRCSSPAPQSKEKKFDFELRDTGDDPDRVPLRDLRAFEIYIEGKDIDSGSWIQLGLFDESNQLLAKTVVFVPASGRWTLYRLKLNYMRNGDKKLSDIKQIKMHINDGSTGYYFDVWTSHIRIYSENIEFFKMWDVPVYWEAPYLWSTPARYKTESYLREPPKWQRIIMDNNNDEPNEDCEVVFSEIVDYSCNVKSGTDTMIW